MISHKDLIVVSVLFLSYQFSFGSEHLSRHAVTNERVRQELMSCVSQAYNGIDSRIARTCLNNPEQCRVLTMSMCSSANPINDLRVREVLKGPFFDKFTPQEKNDFIGQLKHK